MSSQNIFYEEEADPDRSGGRHRRRGEPVNDADIPIIPSPKTDPPVVVQLSKTQAVATTPLVVYVDAPDAQSEDVDETGAQPNALTEEYPPQRLIERADDARPARPIEVTGDGMQIARPTMEFASDKRAARPPVELTDDGIQATGSTGLAGLAGLANSAGMTSETVRDKWAAWSSIGTASDKRAAWPPVELSSEQLPQNSTEASARPRQAKRPGQQPLEVSVLPALALPVFTQPARATHPNQSYESGDSAKTGQNTQPEAHPNALIADFLKKQKYTGYNETIEKIPKTAWKSERPALNQPMQLPSTELLARAPAARSLPKAPEMSPSQQVNNPLFGQGARSASYDPSTSGTYRPRSSYPTKTRPQVERKKSLLEIITRGKYKPKRAAEQSRYHTLLVAVRDVVIAVALLFILVQFISPTVVNEHSMENTFTERDILLIASKAYWFGEPTYNDIVVFRATGDNGESRRLVKRIIGLPGDRIRIADGQVYRNDELLDEPYTKEMGATEPASTLLTVPEDCYYVLGDNRAVSRDSRSEDVGFVQKSQLQGKIVLQVFPLNEFRIV